MIQYVGIDVSAKTLHTALQCGPRLFEGTFDNTPAGHHQLLARLHQHNSATETRIVLESTGIYGLDVALRLAEQPTLAVMVANPRAVKAFAKASMQRGKTDPRDARLLLQFAQRMHFRPWQPPATALLQLRQLVRRIAELTGQKAAQKNRRHALQQTQTALPVLLEDIDELTVALEQRIDKLEEAALSLIEASAELKERYELLLTVPGVGRKSALRLLGELAVLPPDMDVRQWVAHCGLDPQPVQSGTSVHRGAKISKAGNKHLRHALFLPAMTAARCNPQLQAFRDKLVARGRKRIQALVALMRKLLHAIYGMFRTRTPFDVTKLLPA
jgi:transposase